MKIKLALIFLTLGLGIALALSLFAFIGSATANTPALNRDEGRKRFATQQDAPIHRAENQKHGVDAGPAEIDAALQAGAAWLASNQGSDGSWTSSTPHTCFALSALQQHAYHLGFATWDDPGYPYRDHVIQGWQYVLTPTRTVKVSPLPVQPAGDPDTNGNGYGVAFEEQTYLQGPCMIALAASGTPNRQNDGGLDYDGDGTPDTFLELAQEAAEWLAFGQIDGGIGRGNWDYGPADNEPGAPDQSNGGFAVLGLTAAESMGAAVPDFARTELDYAIDYIQCDPWDNNYEPDEDGGAGYNEPCTMVNQYKAAFLILQMGFYGDGLCRPRFQDSLAYIDRHWQNSDLNVGWGYDGDPADYLAMFSLAQGLQYNGISLVDTDGDGYRDDPWYNQEPAAAPAQDFASALVSQQAGDGSWNFCNWGDSPLCTSWALLVLQSAPPALADLSLVKNVTPGPTTTVGEPITYTLAFFNNGALTATQVVITEAMPIDLLEALTYTVSSGVTLTDTGAAPPYVWQVSDLAPGTEGIITLTGQLSQSLPSGYVLSNTASITTGSAESNPCNNSSSAILAVLPDVTIVKSVAPTSTVPGAPITYSLAFLNAGLDPASGVIITDFLPASLTDVSVVSSGVAITQVAPGYVWAVQDLDIGQGGAITLSGRLSLPLAAGTVLNLAQISTAITDANPNNNQSQVGLTVLNAPPLANNDSYTTPYQTRLQVAAPGVLSNDSDPNGSPFVAVLDSPPATGTFNLNLYGAFNYTPPPGLTGLVTFTYHALDGQNDSNVATVAITVTPPPCVPATDVHLSRVTTGTLYPGDLVEFEADVAPDQASPPYTYTVDYGDGGPISGTQSIAPLVLSHTYAATGTYPVEVGLWNCDPPTPVTDSLDVTVYPPGTCVPLEHITILGATEGYPGEYVFNTDYSPAGASLPISYTWDDGGTTASSSRTLSVGVHSLSLTATNCLTSAVVTDSHTITITPAPVCTPVTGVDLSRVTTGTLYPGDPVQFSADLTPNDASRPYTYTVDYGDGSLTIPALSSDDPLVFSHTYSQTGSFGLEMQIWNCAEAQPVTKALDLTVYPPGECVEIAGLELTQLTLGAIHPGDPVDFRADLSPDGASLPYTYTVDYGDGTTTAPTAGSDDPFDFGHTYAATGTYSLTAWAWNCNPTPTVSGTVQVVVSQPTPETHTVYLPIIVKQN